MATVNKRGCCALFFAWVLSRWSHCCSSKHGSTCNLSRIWSWICPSIPNKLYLKAAQTVSKGYTLYSLKDFCFALHIWLNLSLLLSTMSATMPIHLLPRSSLYLKEFFKGSFWQFKCHFNHIYIYIYIFFFFEGDGMKIYVVLSDISTEKLGFSFGKCLSFP